MVISASAIVTSLSDEHGNLIVLEMSFVALTFLFPIICASLVISSVAAFDFLFVFQHPRNILKIDIFFAGSYSSEHRLCSQATESLVGIIVDQIEVHHPHCTLRRLGCLGHVAWIHGGGIHLLHRHHHRFCLVLVCMFIR